LYIATGSATPTPSPTPSEILGARRALHPDSQDRTISKNVASWYFNQSTSVTFQRCPWSLFNVMCVYVRMCMFSRCVSSFVVFIFKPVPSEGHGWSILHSERGQYDRSNWKEERAMDDDKAVHRGAKNSMRGSSP